MIGIGNMYESETMCVHILPERSFVEKLIKVKEPNLLKKSN